MSNQYIEAVAKYLRNKCRNIKTYNEFFNSDCRYLRIYGFLVKNQFYVILTNWISDDQDYPDSITQFGNVDDLHVQQMCKLDFFLDQLCLGRTHNGKPAFSLISEIKSEIKGDISPLDTFDPNWNCKSREYHITVANDIEDDGMCTPDIEQVRKYLAEYNDLWLDGIQYITYSSDKDSGIIIKEIIKHTRNI